ncbi:hypothetical protein GGR51DRAFT_571210 [Nemania sp. FL0031]|nr:hypothetical protein GGR51DRAFT_571210 [Nemania sp. FL0031]
MDKPYWIARFYRDDFEENSCFETNPNAVLEQIFLPSDWWISSNTTDFCHNQWCFFPLVFREETFRYTIPSSMRLPYTKYVKKSKAEDSNYSRVEKRSIYQECFECRIQTVIDGDKNICVAVKKLKHSNQSDADQEAKALERIRNRPNVHLIKAIAYIQTEKMEFSFVFPWAEHGNLWELWANQERAPRDRDYFVRVFRQLTCLASAIDELSNMELRHGDLKPGNIVCFQTDDGLPIKIGKEHNTMVRLVIIDAGLAKIHEEGTECRSGTDTKVSTRRYAAPELEIPPPNGLSRRFDVWSMGCILLEFAIWLIDGQDKLEGFPADTKQHEKFKFFVTKPNHDSLSPSEEPQVIAERHPTVDMKIDEIRKYPSCSSGTAIGRLIDLIANKLLMVNLSNDSAPDVRTTSHSACKCVRGTNPAFLRSIEKISNVEKESRPKREPPNENNVSQLGRPYARLNDIWDYASDDAFAKRIFNNLSPCPFFSQLNIRTHLCSRCRSLRLWSLTCSFSDSLAGLEDKANHESCDLCKLLLRGIHDRVNQYGDRQIHFLRAGSYLTLKDNQRHLVANICTTLLSQNIHLQEVQIGFPQLPEPASEIHLKVLKEWMADCDRSHGCYTKDDAFIPTRLLGIENAGAGTIYLLVNNQAHAGSCHYATLSHRWGSPPWDPKFCTYRSNIEELKHGITIKSLPRTFQDAVRIAYGLGFHYIWIDSLCIIQDDPFDWETESTLMERVFSSAYCTIAASSSTGSGDSFLKPRQTRRSVMMKGLRDSDAAYFVCEAIDDFYHDVDQSELNQRGWVLQERALSRRTIYFTERQSYWECGRGVRCETMTRMKNRKASFLGDADFPRSVDQFSKGLRIQIFQDLYARYSKLALSYSSDRPIAIRGLESRLINRFGTSGGVGIFEVYLHRSLLWHRAGHSLKSITDFRDHPVPSWSWMAYDGAISYLTIPFGEVVWSRDIISPFSKGACRNDTTREDSVDRKHIATPPLELEAPIWNLLDTKSGERIMDNQDRTFERPVQCVILGHRKMEPISDTQRYWVLLVHSKVIANKAAIYERVGVGILQKRDIAFGSPQGRKRIQ